MFELCPNSLSETSLKKVLASANALERFSKAPVVADDPGYMSWLASKLKVMHTWLVFCRKYPTRIVYRVRNLGNEQARDMPQTCDHADRKSVV